MVSAREKKSKNAKIEKKSLATAKKKSVSRKKGKKAESEKYFAEDDFVEADILDRLKKIKRKLSVSAALKKAKNEESLLSAVFAEERKLTEKFGDLTKKVEAAQIQLSYFKNPDFMHRHHQKKMEQLEMDIEEYASLIRHESSRADLLEREVERLTEQIIAIPFGGGRDEREELDSIRKEYSILSQKYDMLVSKNIDLSNRLERESSTKSLESLLDSVRNKINAILRSGVSGTKEGDTTILHGLKSEVAQLKRSRLYLGKALYDLGILYLRTGEKENAVEELRAAKELGIEDPETNKIINPH